MKFVSELKRRNVFQTAAIYAVAAWLVLQVGEVTFEPLHFPDWAMTLLVVLVILGFPVVLLLAWFFDITRHGIRKDVSGLPQDAKGIAADQEEGLGPVPSVAVLSFDDMSPDKDQEYLCDGIAEEILNRLAQIRNLRVASRTSSFRFKGLPTGVSDIGRELNVATVLEGSVRKSGDQLRITTQLVSAADGYHLWTHSYDRRLEHMFEIQDDIATQVAEALEVTLHVGPTPECCTTDDVKAYDFFLRGMHYFHRWGLRNVEFSIDMFRKAVDVDPGYARAWAALADSYAMISMYWNASAENLSSADSASMKALELLPTLAESHVSRGLYHFASRNSREAIAEFETALRLDPELFEACYFYGRVRFQRGELKQAAVLFEKAERIRPEDFQAPTFLRQVYRSLGREDEARAAARRALKRVEEQLELNPDDTRALNLGCAALIEQGDKTRAMQWAERSLAIDGDNPDTLYNLACSYALMGESDRAVECLQRANLRGMSIAEWAENDSDLDSLRSDPRFRELMQSIRSQQSITKNLGSGRENSDSQSA